MPTPPPPPPPPHVGLVPVRASWSWTRQWRIACGCGWRDVVRGERNAHEALGEHTSSSNRAR